ncbi:MFS transporter [Aeromicrobium fastidiosum]|uniref:MFS transporter n=1 Tax=Aeromicrobium fastidiosum TaxID=52699 RepID=A0A641AKB9_9ACTN|nr:MFS transporter [Aeromicrobium fastidiosum]KAA1376255.1 MFS transporter [Aeromicrobium fastidiosum]MBP2391851.1 MFS family permease [Aeromicrobium fastidiosum]
MSSRLPSWFRVAAAMFAVGWGANQFAAMLLVYRGEDDFSSEAVTGLFGAYALGLIPALLIVGPISDRVGRRRVMRPVLVLSIVATVILIAGGHSLAVLLIGRLLAGVASGAAFAPGSAWIKELSADRPSGTGARRAALALSAGFGSGPLVAGIFAEWLPAPTVLPYVPHLVLMVFVVAIAWSAPEPVAAPPDRDRHGREVWNVVRSRPFLLGILLTAPWVFGAASTSFATIPGFVTISHAPVAVTGALCGLTLWTGVLVQPFGKRLGDARLIIAAGLLAAVAGLLAGVVVAHSDQALLLPFVAVLLGTGYGLVLVGGLTTIEQIAHRDDLATLNAVFYSLTYLGFAAPLLSTLALRTLSPTGLMSVGAVVALLTIPLVLASRVTRTA